MDSTTRYTILSAMTFIRTTTIMRRLLLSVGLSLLFFCPTYGQQWNGDDNVTGNIWRTGKLGLGISPTYFLDVNGDINTTGVFRVGGLSIFDFLNNNIFIGQSSGNQTLTGDYNLLLGRHTGEMLTLGYNNTFLGQLSGQRTTGGHNNTYVGYRSGQYLDGSVAIGNTFIGSYAGASQDGGASNTGAKNTFIGNYAGEKNTSGSLNIFIGYQTGQNNLTANSNIFMGFEAGRFHTQNDGNVFIGTAAGENNIDGTGNLFLGNNAGRHETASNRLHIGNSPTPLIYGEFDNDKVEVNGSLTADSYFLSDGTPLVGSPWTLNASNISYSAGKVSIGSESTTSGKLQIHNGNQWITSDADYTGEVAGIYFKQESNGAGIGVHNDGSLRLTGGNSLEYSSTYDNEHIVITDEGKVGVGTSEPAASSRLTVRQNSSDPFNDALTLTNMQGTANDVVSIRLNSGGGSSGTYLKHMRQNYSGGHFGIFTSPTLAGESLERMRITKDGYVGIGITEPSTILDVGGDINLSGFIAKDGIPIMNIPTDGQNTFIGRNAGFNTVPNVGVQEGIQNVFLGENAGLSNSNGRGNLILGYQAGQNKTTGNYNILLGSTAGKNSNGAMNVSIGYSAGENNGSGERNVFIGMQAGKESSGSSNIFIGNRAGHNETGSNKLYIENTDSDTPLIYGDFTSNQLVVNGVLTSNDYLLPNGTSIADFIAKNSSGLSASFPFDASMSEANGMSTTIDGELTYIEDHLGQTQGAVLFDGVDAINIPDLGPYTSFTLAARVKFTSYALMNVFSGMNAAWYPSVSDGYVRWYNGNTWLSTSTRINDDQWHDIAFIFNNESGTYNYSIYVDGSVTDFGSGNNTIAHGTIRRIGMLSGSSPAAADNRGFHGGLDKVEVYNRALNQEQIQQLFGGSSSWIETLVTKPEGQNQEAKTNKVLSYSGSNNIVVIGDTQHSGEYGENNTSAILELRSPDGAFLKLDGKGDPDDAMFIGSTQYGNNFYSKSDLKFNVNTNASNPVTMVLKADGKVAIGTTETPNDSKLYVKGSILSENVKVATFQNWPDYVFEKGYQLKSLSEVEKFIAENKHLPEVPSAKEVEENGISLPEMDAALLKKMEELTLYMIQQNKQMKTQQELMQKQNEQIQKLLLEVEKLKKENEEAKSKK